MDDFEIERFRRSVAMLPPGHCSAGAMSRERTFELIDALAAARADARRYREIVAELRRVLDTLDGPRLPT